MRVAWTQGRKVLQVRVADPPADRATKYLVRARLDGENGIHASHLAQGKMIKMQKVTR